MIQMRYFWSVKKTNLKILYIGITRKFLKLRNNKTKDKIFFKIMFDLKMDF
jgi:hypothetical protein